MAVVFAMRASAAEIDLAGTWRLERADDKLNGDNSTGTSPPPPRPKLGFMLDDGEMLGRLARLYGPERAEAIGQEVPCVPLTEMGPPLRAG